MLLVLAGEMVNLLFYQHKEKRLECFPVMKIAKVKKNGLKHNLEAKQKEIWSFLNKKSEIIL